MFKSLFGEKDKKAANIDWFSSCGRGWLTVNGIAVAMQGDKCWDEDVPREYLYREPYTRITTTPTEEHPEGTVIVCFKYFWTIEAFQWMCGEPTEPTLQIYDENGDFIQYGTPRKE
jgi:hypothetical protein